jgi:hypothetical protein
MTSVVDTSVKFFTSQMSGAPALPGVAGGLIAVLDACGKDGFDLKSLSSLTVAGGVATAAYTGNHSAMVDSVVLIAGVTGGPAGWAGLNGEQKITGKPSATAVTFATNLPDGAYTGTITMKMAPLGLLRTFLGTSVAVYKSADPASTGMSLRVDDTGATVARVVGYESMSDVNTGVGAFPSAAQMAGGGYWPKSAVANSTAVQWALFGDSRGFILHVCPSFGAASSSIHGFTRGFGDAVALRPGGDAYGCFLNYSTTSSSASSQADGQLEYASALQCAFPRAFTGLGSSVLHGCYPYSGALLGLSGVDVSLGTFPSVVDGSLRMSKRYFATATTSVPPRAELPGLYSVPQSLLFDTLKFGDRTPGTGALAGRNFFVLNPTNSSTTNAPTNASTGVSLVDVTGPWLR